MSNIVSEIIVRVDGQPVFSGSKIGANVAIQNAMNKAINEGRAEPVIKVTQRSVNYDLPANDPLAVVETDYAL